MNIKKVVYTELKVDELVSDHNAPREHYVRVRESIEKVGMKNPLWVSRKGNKNHIIIGNTRYAVMKDMGNKKIACMVAVYEDSDGIDGTEVTKDNYKSFMGSKGMIVNFDNDMVSHVVGDWEEWR